MEPDPSDLPTRADADRIISGLDGVRDEVSGLRRDNKDLTIGLKKARSLMRVAIGLALISIGGMLLVVQAQKLEDARRQERSIGSCIQGNGFYEKFNELVDANIQTWQTIIDTPGISERTKAFAEAQKAAQEKVKVDLRDCSAEGIRKYLAGQQATTTSTSTTGSGGI